MELKKILAVIKKRDELLSAMLMNATSKKLSGDTVTLGFDDKLHADVFKHNYAEDFVRLASEILGKKINVDVIIDA